jgi:hypothetical protein
LLFAVLRRAFFWTVQSGDCSTMPTVAFHPNKGVGLLVCLRAVVGHAVAHWFRHCATNRKAVESIPDGVIGIFHWHIPSVRIMALGWLSL